MSLLQDIRQNFMQTNNAVKKIIVINVVVFLAQALLSAITYLLNAGNPADLIFGYLTLPASFVSFIYKPWSIVTYMFLHGGFLHILFNMLWLFWMGSLLHEYLGNRRVYQAYFAGGIFGGIIYMIAYNVFPVFNPVVDHAYALGASAGVLSVVVAAATLLPDYPVQMFLFGTVRLKYIALVSVLLDLISIPNGNAGGHIAHLGGALFGFLFIRYLQKVTIIDKVSDAVSGIFSKKKKLKVVHRTTYMKMDDQNKPSQTEIDSILDKISKSGYDSLTKREKEILFKASKD